MHPNPNPCLVGIVARFNGGTLPRRYFVGSTDIDPPDELPETPADAIDSEVEAYAADPGALADLCDGNHDLLLALCRHLLSQVDGIALHIENAIRGSEGAMARIESEVLAKLAAGGAA